MSQTIPSALPHFIDLTGMVFGKWTVLHRCTPDPRYWRCRCESCGEEHDVLGFTLRNGQSTGCKKCRVAGKLVSRDASALTESAAAAELGFPSYDGMARLRDRGIVKPDLKVVANGRATNHYDRTTIAAIKPCVENTRQLIEVGFVEPTIDGHLWMLVENPLAQTSPAMGAGAFVPSYVPVDLADGQNADKGGILSLAKGAEKYDIPISSLKKAVAEAEISAVPVYGNSGVGGHRQLVCFATDLQALADARIPTNTAIDRKRMKTISEIGKELSLKTRREFCTLKQCLEVWADVRKSELKKEEILVKRHGRTAKSMRTKVDGKREVLAKKPVARICREILYDSRMAKRMWNEPLDDFIEKVKTLIAGNGIASGRLREIMRKDGIVGERLRTVLTAAGAGLKKRRVGTSGPATYFAKYAGRTPRPVRAPKGEASSWLKKRLQNGPILARMGYAEAVAEGFNSTAVARALKKLKCERDYVGPLGPRCDRGGIWFFWRLPEQERLADEDMRRIIMEFRATEQLPTAHDETARASDAVPITEQHDSTTPTVGQAAPNRKKTRGRQKGWRKADTERRKKEMLEAWDRGDHDDNKSAAAEAHGFDRSNGTKLINEHERLKRGK